MRRYLLFANFTFHKRIYLPSTSSPVIFYSAVLYSAVDVVEKLVIYLFIGKLNSPVVGTGGKIDRRARWLIE